MNIAFPNKDSPTMITPFIKMLFKSRKSIPVSGCILLLHFYRRLYEQFFIARSRSKMSILHYLMGHLFYFCVPIQYILADPKTKFEFSMVNICCFVGAVLSMVLQHLRYRDRQNSFEILQNEMNQKKLDRYYINDILK